MIVIHALNLIVVLCCCCLSTIYGSKGNPDPSRLKKMRDLIRKEMSIRTNREYNINKRHINVVKPKVDLLDKDIERGADNPDDSDRIELFVRRIDNGLSSGPWNYVQYLPLLSSSSNGNVDSNGRDSDSARSGDISDYDSNNYNNDRSIKDLVSSLSQGGIESESVRPRIDTWVALKVFGKGLGSPVVLEQVKVILPQFKKLNMRNLQFGYKVSKVDTYVSSIERHMHQIGASIAMTTSNDYDEYMNSASRRYVNLTELLSNVSSYNSNRAKVEQHLMNSTHSLQAMEQLMSSIDQLVHHLIATNATEVLVASDGSSIFNGNNCSYATGGIFVIPICDRQQVVLGIDSRLGMGTSSAIVSTTDIQMESSIVADDDSSIIDAVVRNSMSKNNKKKKSFQLPTINNANTCNVVFSGSATDRRPLYLRMTDMAGVVTTPFDAELGTAVMSFLVANLILKRYKMMITSTTTAAAVDNVDDIHVDRTILEAKPSQLSFQFLTDSRAFIRTLRTDLRQELMQKNMTNRLALWSQAVLSYDQLLSSDDTAEVTVDWTMGHPERRDLNINT